MKIWFCLQRHYHWSGSDDDTGSLSGIFWQIIIVFSSGCRQSLETRTKITNPCPCLSFFQPSTHFQAKHRYNNCCQTSIFKDLLWWFAACFSHQRKGGSVGEHDQRMRNIGLLESVNQETILTSLSNAFKIRSVIRIISQIIVTIIK